MAKGYFITQGDKTECGGTVIEGDRHITFFGIIHAREGHAVSCGITGQTYSIIGGIDQFTSDGLRAAGTGNSISSCPCRARFIPSNFHITYDYESESAPAPVASEAASQSGSTSSQPFRAAPPYTASEPAGASDTERCSGGFHLIDQWGEACGAYQYALLRNTLHLVGDFLNEEGYSHICHSAHATRLNIATSAPAPALE